MSSQLSISNGLNNLGIIIMKKTLLMVKTFKLNKSPQHLIMVTSIWELHQGQLLPLLLIDVGLLFQMLYILNQVLIQLAQPVQAKLNQQRIQPKLLQSNVLCTTALTKLIISLWVNFSLVSVNRVAGHVLMSSIVLILKFCRLLLNSCYKFKGV